VEIEEEEEEKPEKKKSDLWLIGCLGLVIIAILALGAYFIYDNFIRKPPVTPELPPASDNQMNLEVQAAANEPSETVSASMPPGIEAHKDV
jgi:flagellar basal body-associated protein FliL